jgi:hypothetical protein
LASVERIAGNPQVVVAEEASAGSANDFYAGDLVKTDASGELVIATAGAIWGIAKRAATGTAGTKIPVELISSSNLYVVKYHTDATSEALIGDTLDFTFTAGAHTVDESGATTDVECVGLDTRDGAVASGRLVVRFLETGIVGVR